MVARITGNAKVMAAMESMLTRFADGDILSQSLTVPERQGAGESPARRYAGVEGNYGIIGDCCAPWTSSTRLSLGGCCAGGRMESWANLVLGEPGYVQ